MAGKTRDWVKTDVGYENKFGFSLIHNVNEGLISIGGTWCLVDKNHNIIAYYPYTHHLCEARLFKWVSEEITYYYRLIK